MAGARCARAPAAAAGGDANAITRRRSSHDVTTSGNLMGFARVKSNSHRGGAHTTPGRREDVLQTLNSSTSQLHTATASTGLLSTQTLQDIVRSADALSPVVPDAQFTPMELFAMVHVNNTC